MSVSNNVLAPNRNEQIKSVTVETRFIDENSCKRIIEIFDSVVTPKEFVDMLSRIYKHYTHLYVTVQKQIDKTEDHSIDFFRSIEELRLVDQLFNDIETI